MRTVTASLPAAANSASSARPAPRARSARARRAGGRTPRPSPCRPRRRRRAFPARHGRERSSSIQPAQMSTTGLPSTITATAAPSSSWSRKRRRGRRARAQLLVAEAVDLRLCRGLIGRFGLADPEEAVEITAIRSRTCRSRSARRFPDRSLSSVHAARRCRREAVRIDRPGRAPLQPVVTDHLGRRERLVDVALQVPPAR